MIFNDFQIKINPQYAELVRPLSDKERAELRESIREKGLHLPIIINQDNTILDGHQRYQICNELDIEPRYEVKIFEDLLEEKSFVIDINDKRRQLNDFGKAELAYRLEEIESEKARFRQLSNLKDVKDKLPTRPIERNGETTGDSRDIAAKKVGVSRGTYERAKTIIKYGTEEQKKKLRQNKSSINKEYEKIRRDIKRQEYLESCKDIVLSSDSDNYRLILGDFIEKTAEIPDNSVDLINTDCLYEDTPYNMMLHEELAKLSIRVLKPGGVLAFITGHSILDKVVIIFDKYSIDRIGEKGLKFWHPFVLEHSSNHSRLYDRHIIPLQKPILMYVKGGKLNENVVCNTVGDVIKSSRPGKEFHDMQQSTEEAEHFIKNYTLEDHGVVLDPMMGSATTGIAASNLKRKFIGIEKDENSFKIARARINKTIK